MGKIAKNDIILDMKKVFKAKPREYINYLGVEKIVYIEMCNAL